MDKRRATGAWAVCNALAITMFLGPRPVQAAPSEDDEYAQRLEQIRTAAERARNFREANHYAEEIEALLEAVSLIPSAPELVDLLRFTAIRQQLARAHVDAYGQDGDEQHLVVARDQLDAILGTGWSDAPPELEPQVEAMRTDAEALLAQVDELLAEIEAQRAASAESSQSEVVAQPQPETGPEPEPEPEPGPSPRPMFIAGGVLVGLGVAGAVVAGVGFGSAAGHADEYGQDGKDLSEYDDHRRGLQTGNAIGITGAVAAGVFLVAGAALLGVGAKRKKAASGRVAAHPVVSSSWAGLSVTGRF